MRRIGLVLVLLSLVAFVGGCNQGRKAVKKVDVSGKVTLDGQPVDGIEVHFIGEGHHGTGVTRSDGTYSLVTGGEPGENVVYFSVAMSGGGGADPATEGLDAGQMEAAMSAGGGIPGLQPATGPKIPPQYTDPAKTTLKFDVPAEGATDADFRLTSN